MTAEATTIENLTTTAALHLLATHLGGDPQHGDAAAGFYVDEVKMNGESLTVVVGDEQGQTTAFRLTARLTVAQIPTRAAATPRQPSYLDPQPFFAPAT